ncbi:MULTISPECIES: PTS sugar transporter subunit IIA [unclassified Oceanispirochaeta]|uniref:PTS sugar transporter subunit IIA n=1 Tax=unclassified Oceanispirochaeta TaxID=2635722 RepID=UPI000E08E87E|nr:MULTISPECIES: PTS sugar transporter subunit IIA [unclassified Oceanispirochaeta]MBF9015872.1 PTS sugar transporter subunit IIA [Oceanispirochaeta sp. M2]NPD72335.1 PTS sugar transporter subunit IIA [Oceanispirochaeta sp. M1]RDG32106.1 PTS sugar transporter subunit IIA [Oceanispirochaeta sp. M1]
MSILELISEDCIKVPLESRRKNDLLHEMIDMLKDAGKIEDADTIYQAVSSREDQGSTGLGEGIAIPHAKTDAVSEMTLAIGISPDGIDFESLDGEDAKVFFMILAPSNKAGQHIEALSEVARLTRSAAFMRTLIHSENAAEVLELFQE